jgi:uncharacterized membrane protein YphA (DoxX/SURF4 family)
MALLLCPFMLRMVLGVTFTFAGLGYLFGTVQMRGADAAALANLGIPVSPTSGKGPGSRGNFPPPAVTPSQRDDRTTPTFGPGVGPATIAEKPRDPNEQFRRTDPEPLPAATTEPRRGSPAPGGTKPAPGTPSGGTAKPAIPSPPTVPAATSIEPARLYTAADFLQPVTVRKAYVTALKIHYAAIPPTASANPTALLPTFLGEGMWPGLLAHSVAVIELMAGMLLIAGIYCRFWACLTGLIMLGALLIDQMAPAIRAGSTMLWVLPAPAEGQAWHDIDVYRALLWQLALAAASFSVMLMGAGAMALDNSQLFAAKGGKRGRSAAAADAEDDGE